MEVIITKEQLRSAGSCQAEEGSPEWSEERQSLVYSDWDATVNRLLSTRAGNSYLGFLVFKQLVPMNQEQLREARNAAKVAKDTKGS